MSAQRSTRRRWPRWLGLSLLPICACDAQLLNPQGEDPGFDEHGAGPSATGPVFPSGPDVVSPGDGTTGTGSPANPAASTDTEGAAQQPSAPTPPDPSLDAPLPPTMGAPGSTAGATGAGSEPFPDRAGDGVVDAGAAAEAGPLGSPADAGFSNASHLVDVHPVDAAPNDAGAP